MVKQGEKLKTIEENNAEALDEIKELERQEEKIILIIENITKNHFDSVESLKGRLLLEQKSKINSNKTSENILNAIDAQLNRNSKISEEFDRTKAEVEMIDMVLDHNKYEILKIQEEMIKMTRQSQLCIDSPSVERILCEKCLLKVFGAQNSRSVLDWQMKTQKKVCNSCFLF